MMAHGQPGQPGQPGQHDLTDPDGAWADPNYRVDSTTRACCSGIGHHTRDCTDSNPAQIIAAAELLADAIDNNTSSLPCFLGAEDTHVLEAICWAITDPTWGLASHQRNETGDAR